jgi:dolichol kinase
MAQHSPHSNTVVTRKWFHLVAILLFGPITWKFPQLMSLSYAIALCGLIVLETLRADFAILQSFYLGFVDPTKDDTQGGIILLNMCLILGCAAPLWISKCCSNYGITNSNNMETRTNLLFLLPQWGVLSLGVGDAVGAIVGKGFGRHWWGKNQEMLEGSLAMWVSIMAIGGWCWVGCDCWWTLVAATTFVTMLEAFTLQMDNLVLPLAGSAVILLLLTPK